MVENNVNELTILIHGFLFIYRCLPFLLCVNVVSSQSTRSWNNLDPMVGAFGSVRSDWQERVHL